MSFSSSTMQTVQLDSSILSITPAGTSLYTQKAGVLTNDQQILSQALPTVMNSFFDASQVQNVSLVFSFLSGSSSGPFILSNVTQAWSPATTDWSTRPNTVQFTSGVDYTWSFSSSQLQFQIFNIFVSWLRQSSSNNGLHISTTDTSQATFASQDYSTLSLRPALWFNLSSAFSIMLNGNASIQLDCSSSQQQINSTVMLAWSPCLSGNVSLCNVTLIAVSSNETVLQLSSSNLVFAATSQSVPLTLRILQAGTVSITIYSTGAFPFAQLSFNISVLAAPLSCLAINGTSTVNTTSAESNGTLACPLGFAGPNCTQCATGFYSNSSANCSTFCNASTTCNGFGACSSAGVCVCDVQHAGPDCVSCGPNYFSNASGSCMAYCSANITCSSHGTCSSSGSCLCYEGFGGPDCSVCSAGYFSGNSSNLCDRYCNASVTCSGHGQCSSNGSCLCSTGFTGADCAQCGAGYYSNASGQCAAYCTADVTCSAHGACLSNGTCLCFEGFGGPDCSVCSAGYFSGNSSNLCDRYCNASVTCSGHGQCSSNGSCLCSTGFTGADCAHCAAGYYNSSGTAPCSTYCDSLSTCSGNGICSPATGQCVCKTGFRGPGCSECAPGYYTNGSNICGVYCNASTTCGGRGTCGLNGSCSCAQKTLNRTDCAGCELGFFDVPGGSPCSRFCNANTTCSGHGTCSSGGLCVCDAFFVGPTCSACSGLKAGAIYPACDVGVVVQPPTRPSDAEVSRHRDPPTDTQSYQDAGGAVSTVATSSSVVSSSASSSSGVQVLDAVQSILRFAAFRVNYPVWYIEDFAQGLSIMMFAFKVAFLQDDVGDPFQYAEEDVDYGRDENLQMLLKTSYGTFSEVFVALTCSFGIVMFFWFASTLMVIIVFRWLKKKSPQPSAHGSLASFASFKPPLEQQNSRLSANADTPVGSGACTPLPLLPSACEDGSQRVIDEATATIGEQTEASFASMTSNSSTPVMSRENSHFLSANALMLPPLKGPDGKLLRESSWRRVRPSERFVLRQEETAANISEAKSFSVTQADSFLHATSGQLHSLSASSFRDLETGPDRPELSRESSYMSLHEQSLSQASPTGLSFPARLAIFALRFLYNFGSSAIAAVQYPLFMSWLVLVCFVPSDVLHICLSTLAVIILCFVCGYWLPVRYVSSFTKPKSGERRHEGARITFIGEYFESYKDSAAECKVAFMESGLLLANFCDAALVVLGTRFEMDPYAQLSVAIVLDFARIVMVIVVRPWKDRVDYAMHFFNYTVDIGVLCATYSVAGLSRIDSQMETTIFWVSVVQAIAVCVNVVVGLYTTADAVFRKIVSVIRRVRSSRKNNRAQGKPGTASYARGGTLRRLQYVVGSKNVIHPSPIQAERMQSFGTGIDISTPGGSVKPTGTGFITETREASPVEAPA